MRENRVQALVHAALARNPDASMVGVVRAFPMTWWASWANNLLAIALGFTYILSGPLRFSSPAFTTAKSFIIAPVSEHMAPMHVWGLTFIALGVLEIVSVRQSLKWTRRLYKVASALFVFYGVLFLYTALQDSAASFGGFVLYLYVAVIHVACAQTLELIEQGITQ
jgi:hypothetical protein